MSNKAFASWLRRYITLLRHLKSLEDSGQDLRTVATLHREIYNLLLSMAPAFQHLDPSLGDLLGGRKEQI